MVLNSLIVEQANGSRLAPMFLRDIGKGWIFRQAQHKFGRESHQMPKPPFGALGIGQLSLLK
jgi:hypothetical protein